MKPSTLRYIRNEQDVWGLLWRIIPRAVREYSTARKLRKQNINPDQWRDPAIDNDGVIH